MSDNSVVAALNAFPLGDNEEDLRFRLSAYGAKDLRGAYSSLQIQPQGKDRSALNNKAGYVSLLCEYWVALRDGAAVTANSTPKPGSTPVTSRRAKHCFFRLVNVMFSERFATRFPEPDMNLQRPSCQRSLLALVKLRGLPAIQSAACLYGEVRWQVLKDCMLKDIAG
ncbi:hypothetical protein PC117_g12283 [Phytophthora cactorum]|uniref:Uncharacterized protein n=1 Tax=Phytophthora cactorum TaxID=29920 RepID=A0A8T1D5Y9_9STRA|nr:hypothetical protein PC117_g12283 [Phytophthora cactorum]